MKIAVCDDEKEVVSYIIELLRDFEKELGEDFYIQGYTNPNEFINACKTTEFDLIYLDMEMKEYSGVDVAMEMRTFLPKALLIYVTAHMQHFQKSFYVEAFQYILKPICPKVFRKELKRAYLQYKSQIKYLDIPTSKGVVTMKTSNILYIETSYKECKIYCIGGSHFGTSKSYRKIRSQLEELGFCKAQRSYLVNVAHIVECSSNCVVMDNGDTITLSRLNAKELKQKFLFMGQ